MKSILTRNGDRIIVDDEDFDRLNAYSWCLDSKGYAQRKEPTELPKPKQRTVLMHRQILDLVSGDGKYGDHVNGNRLDNRRANLRICSNAENMRNRGATKRNTSGFKGVSCDKRDKKWAARLMLDGKQKYLGYYTTPEEAHAAYCQAATELHGAFANPGDRK